MASPGPYRDGKVHVLSEKCSTCVFRPGNLMRLGPGRLKEIIGGNREADSALTCHQTLPYGAYPDAEPAVCRGYYDRFLPESLPLRMATAMHLIEEDDPPGKNPED